MLEFLRSGGWLMLPILACSVISVAIIIERSFALRRSAVVPSGLSADVDRIASLRRGSALGQVLAAGLATAQSNPSRVQEAVEEAGRHVVHGFERYLNALGTIAATTPLLGLLGTVIGMIKVFAAITTSGVGDPQVLAGGIYEALITTAAGLSIGIPSLMFHRYFRGRISELTVEIEQQALRLLDLLRQRNFQ
ncbi:MAG: biopolymer transporter ExbB [Candidatus Thioglobus sp. MED-G23]|nr:MAG: biopolymer transporter ExbB [Candidatus Thioglobus sp. MED-G23]